MDNFIEELASVTKGQKTIAVALQELEIVKEAFIRSSRIEKKITMHDSDISEIKAKMDLLSNQSYINSKSSEIKDFIENLVKSKLEEFSYSIVQDLSKKISEDEVKRQLDSKVSMSEHGKLKNNIESLKFKLNSYLDVEYPAHKAKMQNKLTELDFTSADSSNLKKIYDLENIIESLKARITDIEEEKFLQSHESEIYSSLSPVKQRKTVKKIEEFDKDFGEAWNEKNVSAKILDFEEDIRYLKEKLEKITSYCERLGKGQKELRLHFIDSLRNKDLQNQLKRDQIKIEKLPGSEVKKIQKAIFEKNERMIMIENGFKHINTEVDFLKQKILSKFSEFYLYLQSLEKNRQSQGLEFKHLQTNVMVLESCVSENLTKLVEELSPKKNTLRILESEDKKLKRSYESIKGITDEFTKTLTPVHSRRPNSKLAERSKFVSPRVTARYKN